MESQDENNTLWHCKYLQSVTLPKSLKQIGDGSFSGCESLISIIIPDSLERIGQGAFERCKALQMIALPQNVTVADDAFTHCDMLNRVTNERDIINWLKTRFDDLPLHQLCYDINDTNTATDTLATLEINAEALIAQDAMGMTPFHVLLSNPFATPCMLCLLVSKNLSAAQVRNNFRLNPLGIYLERIDCPRSVADELSLDGADYNIHEMIGMGWDIKLIAILLALKGNRFGEELNNTMDEATGLYPFMTGAMLHQCRLADVYMMRKETSFLRVD